MDNVVNWFLLLIIFVFDPLAIALIVSANMAFAQIRKPKESEDEDYFVSRNKHLAKVAMSPPKFWPDDMEFNTPYPIKEEQKDKITYPDFAEQHYNDDEVITLDGGEIEVTVEPTPEQMEAIHNKYEIYGEYYTTDEIKKLGERIVTNDKTQLNFYKLLSDGNIKEAISILKQHKIIK